MKNIKKMTVIVLCIAVLLQLGVMPALGNEEILPEKELDFLNTIGITDYALEDTNFNENVTRAEFAVAAAGIYGIRAAGTQSMFSDMQGQSAQAISAANFLAGCGLIHGTGEGIFSPNAAITQAEANKILVSMLGYAIRAENMGGYPDGYIRIAAQIGLGSVSDAPLTRSDMIRRIYKALSVDIMQTDNGIYPEYKVTADETLLTNVMKIYKLKGVRVTGNETGVLNGSGGLLKGFVEIDGEIYRDPVGRAGACIGKTADIYYKEDDFGERSIVYAEARLSGEAVTISYKDINSISGYTINYQKEGQSSKSLAIAEDAIMIFNGAAIIYDAELIDTGQSGGLTAEKSSGSSKYDIITVRQYTNMVADTVDYERMTVYDKIVGGRSLELKKYIENNSCKIIKEGTEGSISLIGANSVLGVYYTPDDSCITVEVSDGKTDGTLTASDNDSVTIGGEAYQFASSYVHDNSAKMGSSCTAYINSDSELIYLMPERASSFRYGFVISGGRYDEDQTAGWMRLLTEEGSSETYRIDDKVKINGVRAPKGTSVPDAVNTALGGGWSQQLILYKINSDGYISEITTAKQSENITLDSNKTEELYLDSEKANRRYKSTGATFGLAYSIDAGTKVFLVSPSRTTEAERFAVRTKSFFTNDTYYDVAAYNVNDGGIADAVVCWREIINTKPGENASHMMIDHVDLAINNDDEQVYKICGLVGGKYAEYLTEPSTVPETDGRMLKRGDVIRISINAKGALSGFIVDVNVDKIRQQNTSVGTMLNNAWSRSGVFYSKAGGYAWACFEPKESLDETFADMSGVNLYSVQIRGNIMVYDEETDSTYVGTANDILTYAAAGKNACRFFARFNYESIQQLFIFQYSN